MIEARGWASSSESSSSESGTRGGSSSRSNRFLVAVRTETIATTGVDYTGTTAGPTDTDSTGSWSDCLD